ncbi:MAG: hypothetical protein JWM80_6452, partial [Cyanobacteria bacterium RYN_339]|nr:hypothetical protein [Cyanobacteria bacterium RYN_339]
MPSRRLRQVVHLTLTLALLATGCKGPGGAPVATLTQGQPLGAATALAAAGTPAG